MAFHPQKDFLIGTGIKGIEVRAKTSTTERTLFGRYKYCIIRNDGTEKLCSLKKCVNFAFRCSEAIILERFYSACREVVRDDILEYKRKYIQTHWNASGFIASEVSGQFFPYSNAEIHHEGVPFKDLVRSFIKEQNKDLSAIIKEQIDLWDHPLVKEFRQFHKEKAILKVVSRKEHHEKY